MAACGHARAAGLASNHRRGPSVCERRGVEAELAAYLDCCVLGPRLYSPRLRGVRPGAPGRLHVVALDGVYLAGPDGRPVFRALGRLRSDEVAGVVQITKVRVPKAIERRGVVRVSPEALEDDAQVLEYCCIIIPLQLTLSKQELTSWFVYR